MPVITIPFDYDPQKYGESLVPIFVNDTDDSGNKIYFGWIEAVVPVQDKLRTLAKRVLGDIWRVSELTDETVHHLWSRYRENLGPRPSHRVYTTAQYKVHSLEDPGGRFHRGKHVALDALDALQQDALAAQCTPPQRASSWANRLSDLENKLQELGTKDDLEVYRMLKSGYYWREIGNHVQQNPNNLWRKFDRLLTKVRKAV